MYNEFLNPYNFIKLPPQKAKAYEANGKPHTGVIEYCITTQSPLFIPNTSSSSAFSCDVKDHDSYDFYSYTELEATENYEKQYFEPVIPGSEIRGMVRSVYETLTDSCMGLLNEEKHPIMRVQETYIAGLLKRSVNGKEVQYSLFKAKDYIYRKSTRDGEGYRKLYKEIAEKEGTKVYFNAIDRDAVKAKSLVKEIVTKADVCHKKTGYLIKGMEDGEMEKKHNCHIFESQEVEVSKLDENDIKGLQAVIGAYQEEPNAQNAYVEYQKQLELFLKGKGEEYFPVYYSTTGEGGKGNLYLAPSCFTKERSKHSLKELAGEFAPCKQKGGLCPACALFGMVGESHEQAVGSSIRFADARVKNMENFSDCYDAIVTLEALGAPRINNTEFYLHRPDGADFWNYDYYVKQGKLVLQPGILRGRKFYWHQYDKKLPKGVEKTNLNKTVRPVKKGVIFQGKLFFESISDKQLHQLLWILNGGNKEEQTEIGPIAYKLGMGKPLGLGSVELKVTKLCERNILVKDDTICYEVEETLPDIPTYEDAEFSRKVKEEFFTISALHATKGKLVTYPVVEDPDGKPLEEGFAWYVQNHIGYDYKRNKPVDMPQKRGVLHREYELPSIVGVNALPMTKSMVLIERGQVIEYRFSGTLEPSRNDGGYVGKDRYNGYGVVIFGVPSKLSQNENIQIEVTNVKDNRIFAKFLCKKG